MPRLSRLVPVLSLIAWCAPAQPPEADASIQYSKQIALGRELAQDLGRAGGITDPAIVGYLERIADRVAAAAGAAPFQIRVTRGQGRYASLLPHGVLYISGDLLARIESEAELAGLFAHVLGHGREVNPSTQSSGSNPGWSWGPCVLASPQDPPGMGESRREAERLATESAIHTLRGAGYDPTAVLDLLSKLAYENPAWGKAIEPDDLLDLRVKLEGDVPPRGGYLVTSSAFAAGHAMLVKALK